MPGFPSRRNTATPNKRYIGLFHYSAYWRSWDEIVGIEGNSWLVRSVGTDKVRRHCTPMHAGRFADAPFEVKPQDVGL